MQSSSTEGCDERERDPRMGFYKGLLTVMAMTEHCMHIYCGKRSKSVKCSSTSNVFHLDCAVGGCHLRQEVT